jgi:hypothetical protein
MTAHSLSQRKTRLGARWEPLLKPPKIVTATFQGFIIHIVIAISGRSQFSPQASRIHGGIARNRDTACSTIN